MPRAKAASEPTFPVTGSMALTVSNSAGFAQDAETGRAIKDALSKASGVSAEYVRIDSISAARRLSEEDFAFPSSPASDYLSRRLQQQVGIAFTLFTHSMSRAVLVGNALSSMAPSAMKAEIDAAMVARGVSGHSLRVMGVQASTADSSAPSADDGGGASAGVVVGVVIAGLVCCGGVASVLFCFMRQDRPESAKVTPCVVVAESTNHSKDSNIHASPPLSLGDANCKSHGGSSVTSGSTRSSAHSASKDSAVSSDSRSTGSSRKSETSGQPQRANPAASQRSPMQMSNEGPRPAGRKEARASHGHLPLTDPRGGRSQVGVASPSIAGPVCCGEVMVGRFCGTCGKARSSQQEPFQKGRIAAHGGAQQGMDSRKPAPRAGQSVAASKSSEQRR